MSNNTVDPRVYFAAEWTPLAWVRTGISIMAFGFVVARFGLFLRLLRAQAGNYVSHGISPYLGAALIVIGVVSTAAGAVQYQRFCRRFRPEELPSPRAWRLSLVLAWALVGLGAALAVILLVQTGPTMRSSGRVRACSDSPERRTIGSAGHLLPPEG